MKPLEDMTISQRVMLMFVMILVILFTLAFCGWITGGWEAQGQGFKLSSAVPGETTKYDDTLFQLDREALFEAYKQHMMHLFAVAMRDPNKAAFDRAQVGARNARVAYIRVMEAIDAREKEK